jgi:hypothetical protein
VKTQLYHIALTDLLWMLIPVGIVVFFYLRWTQDRITIPYALGRMVLQLLSIGYVLVYIFTTHSPWLMGSILMVMLMILGSAGKSVAIYWTLRPRKVQIHLSSVREGRGYCVGLFQLHYHLHQPKGIHLSYYQTAYPVWYAVDGKCFSFFYFVLLKLFVSLQWSFHQDPLKP